DAAGGDDHGLRFERKISPDLARAFLPARGRAGLEDFALDAVDLAAARRKPGRAVAEAQRNQPLLLALAHAAHERLEQSRPRAPGDVKARNGIAVAGGEIAAAL